MTHRKALEGTDKFVSRRFLKEDELGFCSRRSIPMRRLKI